MSAQERQRAGPGARRGVRDLTDGDRTVELEPRAERDLVSEGVELANEIAVLVVNLDPSFEEGRAEVDEVGARVRQQAPEDEEDGVLGPGRAPSTCRSPHEPVAGAKEVSVQMAAAWAP